MTIRRACLIAHAALLGALPLSAVRAQAASTDSTGFRAGQWGAEFSLSGNGGFDGGASGLRFFSDRRALLLGVSGRLNRTSGDTPLRRSESSISLRVGPRWYRPVKSRVLQYLSVGVVASRDQRQNPGYSSSLFPTNGSKTTNVGAGAFGEVGGSWMVTPQLSLGAAWQGLVQYSQTIQSESAMNGSIVIPAERYNLWSGSFGTLSLRAGVFF